MSGRLLLLLAGAAGGIDGISYLGLGQVFTANMTGNTVLLGLAAGQGHWVEAARSAIALCGFVAGVAVGGALANRVPVLAVEATVIAALLAGWALAAPRGWLIGAAALAMGLQSAAVARLDTAGAATTYITGTLTKLVLRAVDRAAGRALDPRRGLALPGAIWVVYGLSALVIGVVLAHLEQWALLLPLAAVLGVVVAEVAR